MLHKLSLVMLTLLLGLTGCNGEYTPEDADSDTEATGLDVVAARTRGGPLHFGDSLRAELSAASPSYLFTFELTDTATVSLRTRVVPEGPVVDTVLLLSRLNQNGRPRLLAASDDFQNTLFSGLDRKLGRGSYQVVVRGHSLLKRGPFLLVSECSGAGCPALARACPFGEQLSDLRSDERFETVSEAWIRDAASLTTDLAREQLVIAVHQSTYTHVVTPAEALAAVDQAEVRRTELVERASGRRFTVYDYGAGDNTYGAIFEADSTMLAASINDGDLLACSGSP